MFRLVVNKSSWRLSKSVEICLKICGERNHSVDWIWLLLERPSGITLSDPVSCSECHTDPVAPCKDSPH